MPKAQLQEAPNMFLNSVLPERLPRFLDVKGCSMQFCMQKRLRHPWEKSMLSRLLLLVGARPAYGPYIRVIFDGEEYFG